MDIRKAMAMTNPLGFLISMRILGGLTWLLTTYPELIPTLIAHTL